MPKKPKKAGPLSDLIKKARRVVKRGERRLRDVCFMTLSSILHSDPLRCGKAWIDRWLEREFP